MSTPSLLQTRSVVVYEKLQCDICDATPLWNRAYVACRLSRDTGEHEDEDDDDSFDILCGRCAMMMTTSNEPDDASQTSLLVALSGQAVEVTQLARPVIRQVVDALIPSPKNAVSDTGKRFHSSLTTRNSRTELRSLLQRLACTDITLEARNHSLATKASVERTEQVLYGSRRHPFACLIPTSLAKLSSANEGTVNTSLLREAFHGSPWCLDPSKKEEGKRRDEDIAIIDEGLSQIVDSWTTVVMQNTSGSHLAYLGSMLLNVLATPEAFQSLPPGRGADAYLLPEFLRQAGDSLEGELSYEGRKLLFCAWLRVLERRTTSSCSTDKNVTDLPSFRHQSFNALGAETVSSFMAQRHKNYDNNEGSNSHDMGAAVVNACSIGGVEPVYCVPLPEMRTLRVPHRLQHYTAVSMHPSSLSPTSHNKDVASAVNSSPATPGRRPITVFVSHAWRTESHPDPDGEDWSLVQQFLWWSISVVVDTIAVLLIIGVDRDVLLERLKGARNEIVPCEHPMGGMIGDGLLYDLLLCAMNNKILPKLDGGDGYSLYCDRLDWCEKVASHVQVWFDYISLPQSPRSKEEDVVFRKTLSSLSDIQMAMHTVTVTPVSTYMNRAWCVAEWLHATDLSTPLPFDDEEDDPHVLPLGMRAAVMKTLSFCSLVDAATTLSTKGGCVRDTEQVLKSLGLKITNGKSDAIVVCRILWESARLWVEKRGLCDLAERRSVLLGSGSITDCVKLVRDMYENGFTRNMFDRLSPVVASAGTGGASGLSTTNETKGPNKNDNSDYVTHKSGTRHVSVYWHLHEPFAGESAGKCFQRDLGGLCAVMESLALSSLIVDNDEWTMSVGLTNTTAIKKATGTILCGFSCDRSVLGDIADIVIPMAGNESRSFAAFKRKVMAETKGRHGDDAQEKR